MHSIAIWSVSFTDGKIRQGNSPSVKALLKGFRIHKPIKLKGTQGNYCDVVLIYEKAWLYGPTSALTLGHKRERALLLLAADTACRPIDVCKLFRVFDGAYRQIAYTDFGMRIRFFWPKEADPGSARQNTTNYYFSKWVEVHNTVPAVISTPDNPILLAKNKSQLPLLFFGLVPFLVDPSYSKFGACSE